MWEVKPNKWKTMALECNKPQPACKLLLRHKEVSVWFCLIYFQIKQRFSEVLCKVATGYFDVTVLSGYLQVFF